MPPIVFFAMVEPLGVCLRPKRSPEEHLSELGGGPSQMWWRKEASHRPAPARGWEVLFSTQTTWLSASVAIGSLGFFSTNSKNLSGSLSTRATVCFRSSSLLAFEKACVASWYSLTSALYCCAGVRLYFALLSTSRSML